MPLPCRRNGAIGSQAVTQPDGARRALRIEYITIAWMVVEATVAVWSGIAAGSIALVGFGLDSAIELVAAGVVVLQLRGGHKDSEQRAVRMIGSTFFVLAAYVSVASVRTLASQGRPEQTVLGVAVTAAALVVMPLLARWKRRLGRELDNEALLADATETLLCAVLAAATLFGLIANALVGWWWADPIAGLLIAAFAIREGIEAWQGG
jgi:divalent metal cation (Fe/Co/Zn/Cd) transporter